MIKAVIFDMDGLLIDSEPLWKRAQLAAFKTVGIEPTDEQMHERMGTGIPSTVAYFFHRQPWKGASQEDVVARIVDDLLAVVRTEGKPRPGTYQVLQFCKAQNLPMAIASSSSQEVIDAVIDTLGIRDFFIHTYSGLQEPYGKPHPGVFISTAGLLGVQPEYCLVFEDAPSGVLAAKAAKMSCIAVPEPEVKDHKFIQAADVIIDSLEEFNEALLHSL